MEPSNRLLNTLRDEFPGEVTSLVRLPEDEAVTVLRQVVIEAEAEDESDGAVAVAEALRPLLGLTRGDTETVDGILPGDSDRYDAICARVLQPA